MQRDCGRLLQIVGRPTRHVADTCSFECMREQIRWVCSGWLGSGTRSGESKGANPANNARPFRCIGHYGLHRQNIGYLEPGQYGSEFRKALCVQGAVSISIGEALQVPSAVAVQAASEAAGHSARRSAGKACRTFSISPAAILSDRSANTAATSSAVKRRGSAVNALSIRAMKSALWRCLTGVVAGRQPS